MPDADWWLLQARSWEIVICVIATAVKGAFVPGSFILGALITPFTRIIRPKGIDPMHCLRALLPQGIHPTARAFISWGIDL